MEYRYISVLEMPIDCNIILSMLVINASLVVVQEASLQPKSCNLLMSDMSKFGKTNFLNCDASSFSAPPPRTVPNSSYCNTHQVLFNMANRLKDVNFELLFNHTVQKLASITSALGLYLTMGQLPLTLGMNSGAMCLSFSLGNIYQNRGGFVSLCIVTLVFTEDNCGIEMPPFFMVL